MSVWVAISINLAMTLVAVGVAWGIIKAQVANLEREMQKKVDMAVFELHLKNEDGRFDRIEQQYRDICAKLDNLINSLRNT
jgi:predicted translin family RNA/ssDNA-binding protein